MLYTEEIARDNIRTREGKRVFFLGTGDQLTPAARDFLRRERIDIRPVEEHPVYTRLGGGTLDSKPEELTHLTGTVLVHKTHPRIAFRGMMDLLEAELMLCQLEQSGETAHQVGEILNYVRSLLRREVLDEPIPEETLCGLTAEELRRRSHRPQEFEGQPHFMPDVKDGRAILSLNRVRCIARQTELAAVRAFTDRDGLPTRSDLLKAMNRMSSMLYLLMIREKREVT